MLKSTLYYDIFESPVGALYLIFSRKVLTGVSFQKPQNIQLKKGVAPKSFLQELKAYFRGKDAGFSQKVQFLKGTDFEKNVWSSLRDIPFGDTKSYKWIAGKVGSPAATRAVGQALSKNPIPIVLPCHRVIESDGSIGGYSSGVNIKRRLLDMEYYSKLNKK
ncbi:MAG: methylated-DNA--[protein]-cysteine S-methyltransferase [Nitrospiraceae bacterium]|nr:MAG: methylated-DNA--[protein]-cysteine S-methyltransferase [Nitrospiraceae bacterium]